MCVIMERYLQEFRLCAFIFITLSALLHLVEAQDQNGFISLDCGLSIHERPYNDPTTGITYSSDELFLMSGRSGRIQTKYDSIFSSPNLRLRYFPDGVRNCYTLNVTLDIKYLIKAVFVYGNYDGLNNDPSFDLYLGPNLWEKIDMKGKTRGYAVEIIYKTECTYLQICLVNTGTGVPMINTLELRPLKNDTYNSQSGSLNHLDRFYFGNSDRIIRYPGDVNDRQWTPFFDAEKWTEVTTDLNVSTSESYEPPQAIMRSASTPITTSSPWSFNWSSPSPTTDQFYIYMHFAEIQTLKSNESREFNVTFNGKLNFERYSPRVLSLETKTYSTPQPCEEGYCLLELIQTLNSTLPPLINALEIYTVINFMQMETHHQDFAAIKSLRSIYNLTRTNWQGDPCVPTEYMWDGLNCISSDLTVPPIIISLDLSSSQLTGIIPLDIQNLTHLQELDLSNNNFTGGIPEFLANIKGLMVINLSGNNLNGSVPQTLLQKKGLKLTLEGNLDLKCLDGVCVNKSGNDGNKKMNIVIPVALSLAIVVVLGFALAIFFVLKKRKRSNSKGSTSDAQVSHDKASRSSKPGIMTKNRRFSYSEVMKMTNNFSRILGKGGFGMVYHGVVNDTEQVAVKMLSPSSSQGYKEFKAEVELLLRVHHKNLVDLVGYCDEGENLALIYEFMANGDVKEHMSGKRRGSILNWETRLKIVIESAQGLEYLHNGCKPPMVHRDVKTTNILLNEHFQAKLADFGLSRSFIEGETHVSTIVAGTPGYLDPEYYRTNWLNEKSDVYSFGVVLLEMITNQPVISQSREKPHIAEWVGVMLTKGDIQNIMDPKLYGDYDSSSVWRAVELAMSCLNPSSARRPTMSHVIVELNECLAYETARGGTSHNMDSQSSTELSMNFRLDVESTPAAR